MVDRVLADGRTQFLEVFLSLVRVCVLFRNTWQRRLPKDEIRFSSSSLRPSGASSVTGGNVEVCLWKILLELVGVCLWWIHLNPVFVRLHSCAYRQDSSDLCCSSSAKIDVLVCCWSYGALARRLPDCLQQQGLSGSHEVGAMTASRLRLALVLVVVARWSIDLDVYVISIFFVLPCLLMNRSEVFFKKR
jgi:hypothetical protein